LEELRRLETAATSGPWEVKECAPCTQRGRLDVGIWDAAGSVEIVGWADSDEYTPADAEFIVAARNQLPRILDALDAVLALADRLDASNQCEDREIAEDIRAAITKALEGKQ
jgi:ABC-type branched-subunit amino acid transport system substrate-binding protein